MKIALTGQDWAKVEPPEEQNQQTEEPQNNYLDKGYFPRYNSLFNHEPSAFNLGIYQTPGNGGDVLKATKYVGIVPLFGNGGKPGDAAKITSRFRISPTDMLEKVLAGSDYYENPEMLRTRSYTAAEWKALENSNKEDKVLFGILNGFGTIELSTSSDGADIGIVNAFGAFEIIDFVNKAKEVCRKSLKKQSTRVEENLSCKVKGRILVRKQIKYNLSRGQEQKMYCSYNKMSEDIRENRIIKYALHLCQKGHGVADSLEEDIRFCMNALRGVPLKKVSAADFIGLKNNSAYKQYKDALEAARKVIARYGISYSEKQTEEVKLTSGKVLPHFIDINLLLEYYCRAVFAKAVEEYNSAHTSEGLRFGLESTKDAKRNLFDDGDDIGKFFMQTYIPDIVINYSFRSDKDEKKGVAAVFDAKNSDVESQEHRSRTHQVLFYMKALGCRFGGLISPCIDVNTKKLVSSPLLIDRKESDSYLYYIPLYIPLNKTDKDESFENYVGIAKSALSDIAEKISSAEGSQKNTKPRKRKASEV